MFRSDRMHSDSASTRGSCGGRPQSGGLSLWWTILTVGVWLTPAGCTAPVTPYPEALISERPAERITAIKHAAEIGDRSVVTILVERLEDPDEAVRFFAIIALEKLTGERFGYQYYDTEVERARAVARWRRYLEEHQPVASRPGGGAAS